MYLGQVQIQHINLQDHTCQAIQTWASGSDMEGNLIPCFDIKNLIDWLCLQSLCNGKHNLLNFVFEYHCQSGCSYAVSLILKVDI